MSFQIAKCNKFFSQLPTKYQTTLILAIPLISLMMMIAGWLLSRQAETNVQRWITHTEAVIRESSNLQRQLVDAETSIRGYGLTENREFLQPYQQALTEIPTSLSTLKKLTQDNSLQKLQLQKIRGQIGERLNLFTKFLKVIEESKQTPNLDPRLEPILTEGKIKMDNLRKSLAEFNHEEWNLLSLRREQLKNVRNSSNILLIILVIFNFFAYWIALQLYYYSQNQLEAKINDLAHLNNTLIKTNELLTERNRELDRFSYVISHDLKAPLRAIANLSQWLEEDIQENLQDKLNDDIRTQFSLLRSRVSRMDAFITALLQYSRIGRIKAPKNLVDVNKLLEEIIDSLNPDRTFQIQIIGEMPVFETESLPLQQVFSNLISNAIKHHPEPHGKIKILSSDRSNDYLFTVSDNGLGIDPKHHQRIFEIFQTLTPRDQKENTGIGLSIVKKIVEKQGGKITLDSKIGQGSSFSFNWYK